MRQKAQIMRRDVYSSYETQSFITKMNDLGANALYDGMTIHPYSGTPQGDDEAWYDDAMLKAEDTGIARVQSYANMLPEGKVPVISEYGIFRSTDTQVLSITHALYIAKVMMEYVRLGSPYIQKHCLVDYYSSAADVVWPVRRSRRSSRQWRRKALTLCQQEISDFAFFLTPSAFVFQMLNKGFGDEVLSASFSQQFTMPNGVTSLSSLVSRDQAGQSGFRHRERRPHERQKGEAGCQRYRARWKADGDPAVECRQHLGGKTRWRIRTMSRLKRRKPSCRKIRPWSSLPIPSR